MVVRNTLLAIVRTPSRAIMWLIYLGVILVAGSFRFGSARGSGNFHLNAGSATLLGAGLIGALGTSVLFAAAGRLEAFRTASEPGLFLVAGIAPRTAVLWLQVRRVITPAARSVFRILLYIVLLAPASAGRGQLVPLFIAGILLVIVFKLLALPAFLATRTLGKRTVTLLGSALIGIAMLSVGSQLLDSAILIPIGLGAPQSLWPGDPGRFISAIFAGDPRAFAVPAVAAVLCFAVTLPLADEGLPELYEATIRRLQRQAQLRSGVGSGYRLSAGAGSSRIPTGALTVLWKDWVDLRRYPHSLQFWGIVILFAAGSGFFVARAVSDEPHSGFLITYLLYMLSLLIFAPLASSMSLDADIGKPIWWLSSSPLRTRLVVWTLAKSWRSALALAIGPAIAGVGTDNIELAVVALPVAVAAMWSIQTIGLAIFSLFSNPVGMRGPLLFLRFWLGIVFLLPGIVALVITALATHNVPIAATAGIGVFVIEGLILIEFATGRLTQGAQTLVVQSAPNN